MVFLNDFFGFNGDGINFGSVDDVVIIYYVEVVRVKIVMVKVGIVEMIIGKGEESRIVLGFYLVSSLFVECGFFGVYGIVVLLGFGDYEYDGFWERKNIIDGEEF